MSKVLRTAAVIAGATALVATTMGIGGVGAALGLSKAALGTVATISKIATVTSTVAGVGAQLTAKQPVNERQGLQLQFKIDPGAPIPYVIGRTAVGGTVVYRETFGTDNHYQTHFVALSLGRVDGIDQRLIDRASITFAGTSAQGYYNRWMWQDVQLGALPEARALGHGVVAPPFGSIPAQVPGWSAQHRMSGYAAASLTMLFDTKARRYQNGEPTPAWVLRGNMVWDPRRDSTYPGGSGPCRRDDPNTWVFSETPALHALKWRLGIFHNGKKVMGVGAPVDLIDVASIVESANVQEANGWKVGGELNSGMDRWEALKMIEEAGGAEPISSGARMATLQKMPRVPIGTIRAADIVEARSIPAMKPRRERINGYRARFRSEAHGWEIIPIDIVQVQDYVAADGGERTGSGDFSLVQNADQAGSLAAYKVFDSREIGPIELVLKPRFIGYRLGDCLTIEADETGLSGKRLIVRGRSIDPETGRVTMTFETETPGKHPAALGQTGVVPPVPTLTFDPDVPPAPALTDWVVTGGVRQDGEFREPAIFVTGAVGNSNAENVVFEVRLASGGDWVLPSIDPPDTTAKTIRGVLSETAYEVAISYKVRGSIGLRRILGPVTTGKAPNAVYDDGRPIEDLKPAEPGANHGAPGDSPIGGIRDPETGELIGAHPAHEVIAKLERIEPLPEAVDLLKGSVADREAAERQMLRDQARLAETLLRLTSEAGRTRDVLRDAGIIVDPATGAVRIYAVDQIAERTSRAEIAVDALSASVTTKASVDYVNEKILAAQLDPSQIEGLDELIARVTTAESSIDGLNAAVQLRATLEELTTTRGRVSTVEQGLSALEGRVTTKAEQTQVDGLATTLGSVEQTLQTLGNVSGLSITIRQARAVADDAGEASLRALLAGDAASRRQIAQIAEVRQEMFAKVLDAQTAEAVARTLLNVQIGSIDARLGAESLARIQGQNALAQQTNALAVTLGGLDASVAALSRAQTDGDTANAAAITQVAARLNAAGGPGVTVEQAITAVTNRIGRVEGRYAVAIDANGNLIGFELIGGSEGPGSFNLINTDLRMGTGRVIFNNGTVMRVQGTGFGANRDLITWFGPTMAIEQCTRANAISFESTDGEAHYQSVSGGTLSNRGGSSSLAADAIAYVDMFGSNGGQINYVASWSYRRVFTRVYPATAAGRQSFEADRSTYGAVDNGDGTFSGSYTSERAPSTISLQRSFDGTSYTQVGQQTFTTERRSMSGTPPVGADAPGSATFSSTIGGGVTVNDPILSTANRSLRLVLSRSFTFPADGTSQRLSILTTEE